MPMQPKKMKKAGDERVAQMQANLGKVKRVSIRCGKHLGVTVDILAVIVEPEFLFDNWTSQIPCPMCVHEAVLKDDSLTSRSWGPSPRPT